MYYLKRYDEALDEINIAIKINISDPNYLITYSEIIAFMDDEVSVIKKVSEVIDNSLVNKVKFCELISSKLLTDISNKEKSLLIKFKKKYCE